MHTILTSADLDRPQGAQQWDGLLSALGLPLLLHLSALLRKHKLHCVHWHIHAAIFTISHTYLHWMIDWKPSGPPPDDGLHIWTPSLQTMSWCDLIPTLLSNISFVYGKEYAYLTNKSPIFFPSFCSIYHINEKNNAVCSLVWWGIPKTARHYFQSVIFGWWSGCFSSIKFVP